MKIVFLIVLAIEVFLSHQSGARSGAESRALAKTLHVSERILRTSAHVFLFMALSFLAIIAFPSLPLWFRIVVVGVWCVLDEWSKGWSLFPGRHFSWIDCVWNGLGWSLGICIWLISTRIG